ncbi:MAG: 50S ribosomal protein L18 [Bacilli bacterium]|jgi:large subunit ribosomal protein L18|nr:50S ribosomal protein L18 [Bacilli bacterium]NLN80846.1 50S ribosomal protein L18 [Erysipelotrichia bacterium]
MIKQESRNVLRKRRHARVRKTVSGSATSPRLCVFRSNAHIEAQIINDELGVTLAHASSVALKLENGGNKASAALVGEAIAKLALEKQINKVVFDRGGYKYHGRVKALAEAARKAGLVF